MTQLTLEPGGRLALVSNIDLSGRRPGEQPVFFYESLSHKSGLALSMGQVYV